MAGPDFDNATPAELYEQVAAMDEEEFEALMDDPGSREQVLEAIIDALVGLFRPEKAEGVEAVIHVKLWDAPGGGYDHYELVIDDGSCTLSDSPERAPNVTFRILPVDFLKLVTGNASPTGLALRRRLQVLGDLGLARRVGTFFEVPSRR